MSEISGKQPKQIFTVLIIRKEFAVVNKEKIYIVLRIVLGIIFLWASWDKILDPKGFVKVVDNYAMLPPFGVKLVALILPWVEIICGIFLISGRYVIGSAFIASALMLIFISAFFINIYRGIDVSCGCFSNTLEVKENGGYFYEIMRDFLFMGMGLWILSYKIKTVNEQS